MTDFTQIPSFNDLPDPEELMTPEELARRKGGGAYNKEWTRQICRCGHPMTRHVVHEPTGKTKCADRRHSQCGCREAEAVLKVTDVKHFLLQTQGPGKKHALARGVFKLDARAAEYAALGPEILASKLPTHHFPSAALKALRNGEPQHEWLIPAVCDVCGDGSSVPIPTPINAATGAKVDNSKDATANLLLCAACYKRGPGDKQNRQEAAVEPAVPSMDLSDVRSLF